MQAQKCADNTLHKAPDEKPKNVWPILHGPREHNTFLTKKLKKVKINKIIISENWIQLTF